MLPIEQMLADADRGMKQQEANPGPDMLLGDLACHVRALVAELERVEFERDSIMGRLWSEIVDHRCETLVVTRCSAQVYADVRIAEIRKAIRRAWELRNAHVRAPEPAPDSAPSSKLAFREGDTANGLTLRRVTLRPDGSVMLSFDNIAPDSHAIERPSSEPS